jgi:TetR/AcrR family transcriptional regulator, mexJK operon transcriptional repressor
MSAANRRVEGDHAQMLAEPDRLRAERERLLAEQDLPESEQAGARVTASETRAAGKRRGIIDAATVLFLREGYHGTSMDEVAALAKASKQTVYKHFSDKEQLLAAVVLEFADRSDGVADLIAGILESSGELEPTLVELAGHYLAAGLRPDAVRLRTLVIGEAGRFPELARTYFERTDARALAALADVLRGLGDRGLLRLEDPGLAAGQFAALVLSIPLERTLFCPADGPAPPADLDRLAKAAVRVFLAAHATS